MIHVSRCKNGCKRMISPRELWLIFVMCVPCAFVGGSIYLFGSYVNIFKDRYEWSQIEMTLLSSFYLFGGCVICLFFGLFHVCVGLKFSSSMTTTAGVLGHLLLALKLNDVICLPWSFVLLSFSLIGFYVMGLSNVVVGCVVKIFGTREIWRDISTSLFQVFYGVGNIVWPLIFLAMKSDLDSMFVVLTITVLIAGSICSFSVYYPKEEENGDRDITATSDTDEKQLKEKLHDLVSSSIRFFSFVLEMICSPFFFLLTIILFINLGSTANILSNANSMIILNGDDRSDYVSVLFGAGQTVGRTFLVAVNLIKLCIETIFVKKREEEEDEYEEESKVVWYLYFFDRISSPLLFLLAVCFLQLIVHFIGIFVRTTISIYIYVTVSGLVYGCCWSLFYLVINRVFDKSYKDLKKYWKNHSVAVYGFIMFLAPGLGSIFFSLISGAIYDHFGEKTSSGYICHGRGCFNGTFILQTILSAVSVVFSIVILFFVDVVNARVFCCWVVKRVWKYKFGNDQVSINDIQDNLSHDDIGDEHDESETKHLLDDDDDRILKDQEDNTYNQSVLDTE